MDKLPKFMYTPGFWIAITLIIVFLILGKRNGWFKPSGSKGAYSEIPNDAPGSGGTLSDSQVHNMAMAFHDMAYNNSSWYSGSSDSVRQGILALTNLSNTDLARVCNHYISQYGGTTVRHDLGEISILSSSTESYRTILKDRLAQIGQ